MEVGGRLLNKQLSPQLMNIITGFILYLSLIVMLLVAVSNLAMQCDIAGEIVDVVD